MENLFSKTLIKSSISQKESKITTTHTIKEDKEYLERWMITSRTNSKPPKDVMIWRMEFIFPWVNYLLTLWTLFMNVIFKDGQSETSVKDLEFSQEELNSVFGLELNSTMKFYQSTAGNIITKLFKTNFKSDSNMAILTMDLI